MLERVHSLIAELRSISARRGPGPFLSMKLVSVPSHPIRRLMLYLYNWQEITAVVAFKRDCVTVDLICLLVADNNRQLEINEEDIGWHACAWSIEKHLPGSIPYDSWWRVVAQPAFATNSTIIYSKE